MEGSGQFAYYDFQAQQYVAWEEIIGGYDWSPDGDIIAYDTLSYVPSGDERIYLQDRERVTEAQPLSPQYEDRYAYYPLFSSDGNSLAYLASRVTPEVNLAALVVIQIPDGEPQMLGEFENVQNLAWSPDGERLVFSAGPYENPALMQVSLAERSAQTLTPGRYPALQPAP
jgi:Tol biopolymer transport system component